MPTSPFPTEGEGFQAEVKIGDDIHWILMTWYTGNGYAWGIYNAKVGKQGWEVSPAYGFHSVQNFDDGAAGAESAAKMSYKYTGRKEPFPELNWQPTGSGEVGPRHAGR